jgi:CRP/FNR family transcriptional regulator, cyclic AMP receptor protein
VAKIELFQHSEDYVTFSAGSVIFEEGQPGDTMYAVIAGEVDIVSRGKVLETTGAGGLVGELALIDRSVRSASAVARTDCKLVPVDAKRFQYMVSQTPFFALQVMAIMAERLRRWTGEPEPGAG